MLANILMFIIILTGFEMSFSCLLLDVLND